MTHEDKIREVKMELCQTIRRIALREGMSTQLLAARCRTNEMRIGHVIRGQVDKLTLSQLFRYLTYVYPRYRFMVGL